MGLQKTSSSAETYPYACTIQRGENNDESMVDTVQGETGKSEIVLDDTSHYSKWCPGNHPGVNVHNIRKLHML